MKESFDIVVVGAGMVGLACALALAKKNWQVLLVESQKSSPETLPTNDAPYDIRVVAISRASENLFKTLEVWSLIKESRSAAYQHMQVWDNEGDGQIHFSAADFFEPNLGHIIEQRVIKAALWQKIRENPQIEIRTGEEVKALHTEDKKVELSLASGKVVHAKLVVAADGAHSTLRKLLNISLRGWSYDQSAIVATVCGEKSHHQTAMQRFAPDGPLALLPLSESNTCSIVWTTNPERAAYLMNLSPLVFADILAKETNQVMGAMTLLGERKAFPLKTHHVKDYAKARCVLVGDAAHTIHPLAGQGVNLGFSDVSALVSILESAALRKRDIGSCLLLKRFERQRKGHNQMMILAMEAFKRGFGSPHPVMQFLRNQALNFAEEHAKIKQFFAKLALGA